MPAMNILFRIIYRNKLFFAGFGLFFFVSLACCCFRSKAVNFLSLNFIHTRLLNDFFTYYTFLGDGLMAVIICTAFILFRRYLLATHILLAYLSSGIAAQLIKNFTHAPRPRSFFPSSVYSNFIAGVTQTGWASFPSGHTTTAFALATILALHTRNKTTGLVFLFIAIGEAYSRVYLGQHFLEDVVAGSLIGVLFAVCIFYLIQHLKLFRR